MVVLGINSRKVVFQAQFWLGTPYVEHGRSNRGVDCAGLVVMVARAFGLPFPHEPTDYERACRLDYVNDQLRSSMDWRPTLWAQPGMVVVVKPRLAAVHLGILDSRGTMIAAVNDPDVMQVVRRTVDWTTVQAVYAYRGVVY